MVHSGIGTPGCDMRSLVLSEDVEGGSTEVEGVVRAVSVACPYPDMRWLGPAQSGVKLGGKPKGLRSARRPQAMGRLGMG